jgi:predicted Zn-dependent protease with MMP-like domain
VPWLAPSFTRSDLVAQGAGPDGAAGVVADAAAVEAAGVAAGAVLSDGAGAALPLAVVLEELAQAVARTATLVSAAAANARRATRWVESITVSFYWAGSVSRVTVKTPAPASRLHDPAAAGSAALDNGLVIEVEPERFEEMVVAALDGLPEQLGAMMRNVAVTVEHGPGPRGLLGLYQGVPLTGRTTQYAGVLPDRITIYRLAICAICDTEEEVADQVRRTVIHEVAHHFGIDDERLRELGW